jgi:hypothetical protein
VAAFSRLTNSIPTYVTVAGASGWAIVDTGNPWVLLDPMTFPSTASLSGGGTIPAIEVASQTAANPFVFGSGTGDVMADPTFSVDGNIGCSVLCSFTAGFNYRDVSLTLGGAPPAGVQAAISLPFMLEGGGMEQGVSVPRSRVVVSVSVEGTAYSMILDTGATDVTLSAAAYGALTSDGRAQLTGGMAETTAGTSTSSIARAATVAVGGATVAGVIVAHDSSFDQNLAAVSADVGHTIDGSLGGTFLNSFYVSIDYATQTLSLSPYDDTSFILDAGEHIGITLGSDVGTYLVATVSTDAAAKGVAVGDEVIAVDGQMLASLSELEVATLGFGKVGATENVTFGIAQTVSNMTIPLVVEESLPLPGAP